MRAAMPALTGLSNLSNQLVRKRTIVIPRTTQQCLDLYLTECTIANSTQRRIALVYSLCVFLKAVVSFDRSELRLKYMIKTVVAMLCRLSQVAPLPQNHATSQHDANWLLRCGCCLVLSEGIVFALNERLKLELAVLLFDVCQEKGAKKASEFKNLRKRASSSALHKRKSKVWKASTEEIVGTLTFMFLES